MRMKWNWIITGPGHTNQWEIWIGIGFWCYLTTKKTFLGKRNDRANLTGKRAGLVLDVVGSQSKSSPNAMNLDVDQLLLLTMKEKASFRSSHPNKTPYFKAEFWVPNDVGVVICQSAETGPVPKNHRKTRWWRERSRQSVPQEKKRGDGRMHFNENWISMSISII
jgi:hypothetical protein